MATEKSHEHQRKESDPPSYQADLMEKESVASRIWKRRIAIIYVLLLLAVSATAIYFAIASARLEGELKLKGTKEIDSTEPTGSLQVRIKNDDEEADNDVQGELAMEEMGDGIEIKKVGPVPQRSMLRNEPSEEDQIVGIMTKFLDIAQTAAKDCIFTKHKSEDISFSERKDLKLIHEHILPIASRLGIPEKANVFDGKYSLVLKQLECLMRGTLLDREIEPLLIKLTELLPSQNSDGDRVSILPHDDLSNPDQINHGYGKHGVDSIIDDDPIGGPIPTVLINLPTFDDGLDDTNEIHNDQHDVFAQPFMPMANDGIYSNDLVPLSMPSYGHVSDDYGHMAMPMASPIAMPMENHIAMPMASPLAMPMAMPMAMEPVTYDSPMASPVAMPMETPMGNLVPMIAPMMDDPVESPTVGPMTTTTESPPNEQNQPMNALNNLKRNGLRRKGMRMRPGKKIGMNSRALS